MEKNTTIGISVGDPLSLLKKQGKNKGLERCNLFAYTQTIILFVYFI